jgi:hypothetical protein
MTIKQLLFRVLYSAKSSGRDCFVVSDSALPSRPCPAD